MSDQAPIGAITAVGGLMSSCRQSMLAAGWLPCDGTSYTTASPYDGLFAIIKGNFGGGGGKFNVPDLRGQFLRGVNRDAAPVRDPDNAARQPAAPGGNSGNAVGSIQGWATARPAASFTTDTHANHQHEVPHVPNDDEYNSIAGSTGHDICEWNSDSVTSDTQGAHTHTMSRGGDSETRPDNLYLNWFIKYRSTAV